MAKIYKVKGTKAGKQFLGASAYKGKFLRRSTAHEYLGKLSNKYNVPKKKLGRVVSKTVSKNSLSRMRKRARSL